LASLPRDRGWARDLIGTRDPRWCCEGDTTRGRARGSNKILCYLALVVSWRLIKSLVQDSYASACTRRSTSASATEHSATRKPPFVGTTKTPLSFIAAAFFCG